MKCLEPVIDRRKNNMTRICEKEIYGLTGLRELDAFRRHMRKAHGKHLTMEQALHYRAESEQ